MKIHETTITQNLVYELNQIKWLQGISSFSIYESINEASNGDDLEICIIQRDNHVYKYAVQAKIIYHSLRIGGRIRLDDGVYKQFKHTVGAQNQIDLLLAYAKGKGAIPLYLLYNFAARKLMHGAACNIDFDTTQYGCSLVAASHLKDNYSDSSGNLRDNVRFSDIHPGYGIPWFMLACCFTGFSLEQTLSSLKIPLDSNAISAYNINEIESENERNWKLLSPVSELLDTKILVDSIGKSNKEYVTRFSPKYRIVISNKIL
ncbi:hypothetical protein GCM10009415_28520 [Chitinophaga japonensis]